jgi:hypothetical protein
VGRFCFVGIAETHKVLIGKDIETKRTLLGELVDKVEMGNEKGTLWYTSPSTDLMPGFYMVPPRGFELKNCQYLELVIGP